MAFEREHGPVWLRPDFAPASIVRMLATIYRDPKKHPEIPRIEDFLIGGVMEVEPTEEQMALMAQISAYITTGQEQGYE